MCNFARLNSAYNLYNHKVFFFGEIFQGPSRHLLCWATKNGSFAAVFRAVKVSPLPTYPGERPVFLKFPS